MHEELLAPLRSAPERAGVFLDFDGTLSQIALIPSAARPIDGARDVLHRLADRFAVVAIVSGRAAGDLLDWLGPEAEIWGVHGAETVADGRVVLSARAEPYRDKMQLVFEDARRRVQELGIEGVLAEDKTTMVNLHYRAADDLEHARERVERIAADLVQQHGLRTAAGRLTVELRPPEDFSKEQVVLARAREAGLEAVLFAGDDTVDISAFEALDVLASEGIATVRVAVSSPEAPAELIERADIVVGGPEGTVELLRSLASGPE